MNFLYFEVEFAIPSVSIYLPQIIKNRKNLSKMFVLVNYENIENGKENLIKNGVLPKMSHDYKLYII